MIFWNDLIFDLDHSLKNDLLLVKIKITQLILIFDLDHFTSDLAHLCLKLLFRRRRGEEGSFTNWTVEVTVRFRCLRTSVAQLILCACETQATLYNPGPTRPFPKKQGPPDLSKETFLQKRSFVARHQSHCALYHGIYFTVNIRLSCAVEKRLRYVHRRRHVISTIYRVIQNFFAHYPLSTGL